MRARIAQTWLLMGLALALMACPPAPSQDLDAAEAGADAGLDGGTTDGAVEPASPSRPDCGPEAAGLDSVAQSSERVDLDTASFGELGNRNWIQDIEISGMMLVFVLLLGALVYAVMRWTRNKVRRLALSKPRRALFNRFRPLVEAVVTVLYVVVSVRLILGESQLYSTIVLGLFTLGFIWVSWFAIRDVIAGMLLKASEVCLPGDTIEVDGTVGRVRSLGYRVIALDTSDGGQAFIPYGRISSATLMRKPVTDGATRHSFQVQLASDVEVVEAKEAIRRYALNSHWHSVVREPQIDVDDSNLFTVTVYALAENQGHRIEASVRAALESSPPKSNAPVETGRAPRSKE